MKGMSKAFPSPEDLFAIAAQTVESFPDVFRTPAQAVVIRVEDFIPPDMLEALVSHVTVHEFAHHFGWSDADIARIDPWWE